MDFKREFEYIFARELGCVIAAVPVSAFDFRLYPCIQFAQYIGQFLRWSRVVVAHDKVAHDARGLVFAIDDSTVAIGLFTGLENRAAFTVGIRIKDEIPADQESLVIIGHGFAGYKIVLHLL